MYQQFGDKRIWVSERAPHWKDWRGRVAYKHRIASRRRASVSR